MTITKHQDSHCDHALTEEQVAWVLSQDPSQHGQGAVRVFTLPLPEELGTVPCGLYGPAMGDEPVPEAEVLYVVRGARAGGSRLVDRPARQVREVTIIAGPHDGHEWVLFTAFGGPAAPKEPFEDGGDADFWGEHALSGEDRRGE